MVQVAPTVCLSLSELQISPRYHFLSEMIRRLLLEVRCSKKIVQVLELNHMHMKREMFWTWISNLLHLGHIEDLLAVCSSCMEQSS